MYTHFAACYVKTHHLQTNKHLACTRTDTHAFMYAYPPSRTKHIHTRTTIHEINTHKRIW